MLTTQESLLIHSIEDFLSTEDRKAILDEMSHLITIRGREDFDTDRGTSVHAVEGLDVGATMKLYEPSGRVEIADLPTPVVEILDRAAARALPHTRRLFPGGGRLRSWIYLEYGPGQYITPHIDMAIDDREPADYKVAGIGVPLNDDYTGGKFFVETCGSEDLWRDQNGGACHQVRDGADFSSDWYPALARTRWTVCPAPGTAVLYGSQLTHGTEPVTAGRIKKIIGFFTS
jgi:hypothetical protein